jgi:hypothetical protein
MAKITQYQQGQFANSVVGTPDESLQHSAMLSSANLSNNIGSMLMSAGQQDLNQYQQEQYEKQKQLDSMNKHIADLQQQATVENIATGAETGMQQDMNNLKTKYATNPDSALAEFSDLSHNRSEETLDQYSQNPEMQAMLSKKLAEKRASYIGQLGTWAQSQQVPLAERNLKAAAGNLAVTAGQMGDSTPDQVKALIENHIHDSIGLYQQLDGKGVQGAFDTSGNAVKEYLNAVALKGDPKALQSAIDQFKDGHYITPSHLQSIEGEQLAMAAHQAAINNQIQSGFQQHALLDTIQQLVGAGNGDIKQNNPGINQKILQQAAPNLKPEHLIELTKMIGEGNAKVTSETAKANIEDYITKNSPNGDITKASPEVIHTALNKFGQNLTQIEKAEYSTEYTKAGLHQTYIKQSQTIDENIGQQMKGINVLESQITNQVKLISGLANNAPAHAKALQDLEFLTMRYSQSVAGLSAMHQTIKDPGVKILTNSEMAYNKAKYDRMMLGFRTMADPSNPKIMKDHEDLYNNLETGVKPSQIYSDPRIQQTYNYYHTRFLYDEIAKHQWGDDRIQKLTKSPQAMQAFKTIIDSRTQRALKGLNLIP